VKRFTCQASPTLAVVQRGTPTLASTLQVGNLIRPMLRSDLPQLRNDHFHGGRKIGVPAANDPGLAPEAQRLVIDRDHAVRLPVQQDLCCG
jgi:hypothetical protein